MILDAWWLLNSVFISLSPSLYNWSWPPIIIFGSAASHFDSLLLQLDIAWCLKRVWPNLQPLVRVWRLAHRPICLHACAWWLWPQPHSLICCLSSRSPPSSRGSWRGTASLDTHFALTQNYLKAHMRQVQRAHDDDMSIVQVDTNKSIQL